MAKERLAMYAANMLVEMAKLAFPSERKGVLTHKLQQLVKMAKDNVFKKAGTPSKYWPLLRKLDKVRDKWYIYI